MSEGRRYGVGATVRITRKFGKHGEIEFSDVTFTVAYIRPEEYEGEQILAVGLDDGTGMIRRVFYEDCELATID